MNADVRAVKTPLLSPEQARQMLDNVIYWRLLACIDADGIVELEEELAFALQDCGLSLEASVDEAIDMVRGALLRLAQAPLPERPKSEEDDADDDDDCVICRALAEEAPRRATIRPRRTPSSS